MSARLRVAPAPPTDPWLTLQEAAAEGSISETTLYQAIRGGRLRAARVSTRGPYRIRRSWLDSYLDHAATGGPWPVPSRPR
jgi:excisionase family DNA binding protein